MKSWGGGSLGGCGAVACLFSKLDRSLKARALKINLSQRKKASSPELEESRKKERSQV